MAPPTIECSGVRHLIGFVIMGFFAAFGVLCALWAVFGAVIFRKVPCQLTLRCTDGRELTLLRRLCWLREMGLLQFRLTVLDSSLSQSQQKLITKKFPYIDFQNS